MKTTNRISALVVSLVMLLSLLTVGASAWSSGEGIDVYWNDEKVGTVAYDTMEEHAKGYPAETYSNNKDEYTGYLYTFSKLLKTVNKSDDYKAAADETTIEIADAAASKPATFTKAELEETRNYYDKDGNATAVKPGFMHIDGEDYFRFVFGQKTTDDSTSGRWVKLSGTGNATVKITTTSSEPSEDPVTETGFEVYWNDKSVGTVNYKQIVDDVSQATSKVTYSTTNKSGTWSEETGYLYKFTQLLEALKKDADWEAASDLTTVVIEATKKAEFTKKELTEDRYYFEENGTRVDKVKPGFLTETKDGTSPFKFAFGQKEADEVNKNRFSSFDSSSLTKIKITTPSLAIVDAEGNTTELFYSDLEALWNEEGAKKYNYTNINTYPSFKTDEYWGPTMKAVLAKAGIDLDKLADDAVLRFDSSDGQFVDVMVKDIKATRYTFPNGESKNGFTGTTEAQLADKAEVPYILSITNGKTNLRNVFGQIDPQEEQKSNFLKYINKITLKKDAATEFTGVAPTIADGSTVKKGDKLNFDLTLPTGVYEGFIYYTVSTDGKEPADPTYSDILYNFAQNQEDGKDYEKPEKAKYYNTYEFTDADKTIIKVATYVSGYKPKVLTLTYTKEAEPVSKLNGLVKGPDGKWGMYKDNVLQKDYTGLAKNKNGWYYVKNGYVAWDYTGFGQNLETKIWWRVVDGRVDFNADSIYKKPENKKWYKTTGGKVTWKETGVFKNENGWWRVKDSRVDFSANGIYKNDNGWWKTTNGKVTFKETGVFSNENGTWYVKNSKVRFDKNGKVTYNGKTYNVTNGRAKLA